jgi:hypothetical protein
MISRAGELFPQPEIWPLPLTDLSPSLQAMKEKTDKTLIE